MDHPEVMEEELQRSPDSVTPSPTDASMQGDLGEKFRDEARQHVTHGTPNYSSGANEPVSWMTKALQFTTIQRVASALSGNELDVSAAHLPTQRPGRPWRTAFIRWGPLSGILGMFLALVGMVASLGILAGSDGVPVTSWTAPPSTYLAICTALANVSMRYAAIHGVVIAWWSRASKGSTLAKLHQDWRAGMKLLSLFRARLLHRY